MSGNEAWLNNAALQGGTIKLHIFTWQSNPAT